jgi:hypothetical protein
MNTTSASLEKKKVNQDPIESLAQSVPSGDPTGESPPEAGGIPGEAASSAVPASSSTPTPTDLSSKPTASDADDTVSKQASIQAGSISNLVTVDTLNLAALLDGTAFTAPIKCVISFILLYRILGWR